MSLGIEEPDLEHDFIGTLWRYEELIARAQSDWITPINWPAVVKSSLSVNGTQCMVIVSDAAPLDYN